MRIRPSSMGNPNLADAHTHSALTRFFRSASDRRARRVFLPVLLLATLWPIGLAGAQMHVARNVQRIRVSDSTAGSSFAMRARLLTELQRGYGSPDGELAWDGKLAAAFDVWQRRNTVVAVELGAELTANPYNSSGFNPRAVFAEPAFTIAHRLGGSEWHVTVFHRCRHDIDNLDPPDSRDAATDTTRYKRAIVLSGVQLGVRSAPLQMAGGPVTRVWARVENYPVRRDERSQDSRPLDWSKARGSISAGGRSDFPLGAQAVAAAYVRGAASITLLGDRGARALRTGARVEPGLRVRGASGALELFVAAERNFDDLSIHGPRDVAMFAVGLRLGDHSFF